jgi:hypothetical protein
MKLSTLAAKPQLIEVTLDDEAIVAEFGEPVVFYTWDRQPIGVFMQLSNINEEKEVGVFEIIRKLILNEEGNEILVDENTLPTNVLMKAITKVTELLGK